MKKYKLSHFISLVFALVFLATAIAGSVMLASTPAKNSPLNASAEVYSSAKSMTVMEAGSKRVLYSKNNQQKLPMASTTKIMTAITAIENAKDFDTRFEISPKAVGVPGTSIYLRKGETLSLRELLYGLMLVSGNDASVAIGEHVGGNVKNFIDLMNKTALKIGAKNSHFDNTHGLDSPTHYTTAYDLALITSYALANPIFKEIVSTKNTRIESGEGKTRYLKNKNRLLNSFTGCNGVKTGFTDDAGRCLVSSAERNGMTLVSVVLNCGPMFEECSSLMERGFSEYKLFDLTYDYQLPKTIKVDNGREEEVEIYTKGHYFYPLRDDELNKINYKYNLTSSIEAPLKADTEIGEVEIYIDKDLHFSEKIFTMKGVRGNTIWHKLKDMLSNW